MKLIPAIAAVIFLAIPAHPAAPAKKPAPKPQKTVGELAAEEARKCDANYNGRIEGTEVSQLRAAFGKNPKSWLYLYDDNGNKTLDDQEIAQIKFTPKTKPAPPKPGAKPAAKPPTKPAPKK